MDIQKVTDNYMASYNKIVSEYKTKNIVDLVENINSSISKSDLKKTNNLYNEISEWNEQVSKIQGARDAFNACYKGLKLPSISQFLIVFDNIQKEWRFNTEPI